MNRFFNTRLFVLYICLSTSLSLNAQQQRDTQYLLQKAGQRAQEFSLRKAEAERVAREKGWPVREELPGGGVIEIMSLSPTGKPEYFTTDNLNAAQTTGTNTLWTGESSGLNLTGAGYTVAEWDAGGVLTTHVEFNEGGTCRVVQKDNPGSTHYHSTHVAGTLIAEGDSSVMHGMAPEATLHAYDWTSDEAEMITANAVDGINLSNHSYGFVRGWNGTTSAYWYGDTTISATEDFEFGFYGYYTQQWDDMAYDMPDFLFVKSAGNDRGASGTGLHKVWDNTLGDWVNSTTPRDPDGGTSGYDCIGNRGTCKNILTVGAVYDIVNGYYQPSNVVMTSFSGWGPTDDGRIKPDIVANGMSLKSTYNNNNTAYNSLSGTSMSTPNTCGTLALLQDYAYDLLGTYLFADELKALIINTANEAGTSPGPDYKFGWGLLNAPGMADLITLQDTEGGHVFRDLLQNGSTDEYIYYCDGTQDIDVTIAWTDPAHAPMTPALDPTTLALVHDLDVRVIRLGDNTTFNPWTLNPASPASAASTGDNIRDNVERVTVSNPPEGQYKVVINHKGTLTADQWYGLAVNGMSPSLGGIWLGTNNSDWNNPANWANNDVPDLGIDVVIPAGCTNYPVLSGSLGVGYSSGVSYYCRSITVENGASITIGN